MENPKEKSPAEKTIDLSRNDLTEQIKKASDGLYYISETDAEISLFIGKPAVNVNKETILSQTQSASDSKVEERDFIDFFTRLTEIQEWFGDEESETAKKFVRLKDILEKNLRDLKVFKIGKIELDIYAVGLDAEDKLIGIKTKAIET